MKFQNAIGEIKPYSVPSFSTVKMAKVTSIAELEDTGKIEILLDDGIIPGGVTMPCIVIEQGISISIQEGDTVLIGFIDGKKNLPRLVGLFKDKYFCSNMVKLEKDKVVIQFLPPENITASIQLEAGVITISSGEISFEATDTGSTITLSQIVSILNDHESRLQHVESLAHSH